MANENLTAPEEASVDTGAAQSDANGAAAIEVAAEVVPDSGELDISPVDAGITAAEISVPHVASASSNLSDALSQAPSTGEPSAPRKEVPGGRGYEIVYIVRAGEADAAESTTARVRALIENADGAVDNVRTSETRRLAYPVQKQSEGVYVVVNARFEKSLTLEMERFFRLEETVLRHMVIREEE